MSAILSDKADHLRMSNLKVWEDFGRMVEVETELAMLGAFLRTLRHGVVRTLTTEDTNHVCGNDDVFFCIF